MPLHGLDDEKIAEVVKAVSLLQSVMPWAQNLLNHLAPGPSDLELAHEGKPSSARPVGPLTASAVPATTSVPVSAPATSVRVTGMPAPASVPATAPPPAPATSPPTPATVPKAPAAAPEHPPEHPPAPEAAGAINSSSHRAAHARLARRMASLSTGEAPNMQKLWAGSRKDNLFKKEWHFFKQQRSDFS